MFSWFENRIAVFRDVSLPDDANTFGRFVWHFVRQAPLPLVAVGALGALQAVVQAMVFVAIGAAVNVIDAAGTAPEADVDGLLLEVPTLLLVQLVVQYLMALTSNQAVQTRFAPRVRWQNYRRVVRQSMAFFHNDFAGRISNQVMETGQSLQNAVVQVIGLVCALGVFVISVAIIFAGLYWLFLVPVAAWLAACLVAVALFIPRNQKRARENAEARSQVMGRVVDAFSNMMTVKLFAGPEREDESVRHAQETLIDKASRSMRITTGITMVVQAINAGLMISIFLLSIWQWRRGGLPIGGVVVATTLAFRLQDFAWAIMNNLVQITNNIGTVQNGMRTIALPVRPKARGFSAPASGPAIAMQGVRFGYAAGKTVIDEVSLAIEPMEKVGVVGPSGGGKSTLIALVAGLYVPEAGTVAVGGRKTSELSEDELRSLFSVVSQDTSLFNRSIRDNIVYGRPDVDEASLRLALAEAKADQFVDDLVDSQGRCGLEALVGERGVRLSAGQRQRIAIARAIVKDAPVLLLDEASSALDSATEEYIQAELATLMDQKTVIVVAHRLSTLTRMDRIVAMDKGRIVETGTHDALLAHGGLYHDLWQLQARGTMVA